MKKTMLMGETGAGKSDLVRALSGESLTPRRPMAVEYWGSFINTPGEFLENRRFYSSLITASHDCEILLFLQNATRNTSLFPPQFAAIFNRRVLGVITMAETPGARVDRAERFLRNAGARETLAVDTKTRLGLETLRAMLQ